MIRMIIVFALTVIVFGCGGQSEADAAIEAGAPALSSEYHNTVVLTVADQNFTGSRLAPALEMHQGDSLMVNLELSTLINRILILQDAHARGYDQSRDAGLYFFERQREILQTEWLARILDEKVILPADAVEEYYSRMGTILIYTAVTVSTSELCDSLRQLVLDGGNMGDFAEMYSTIPREATVRGSVGPVQFIDVFPWDKHLLDGLEPGDISSADSSFAGWRFVRIDSSYTEEVPPFSEVEQMIGNRLLGRMKTAYKEVLFDSLRTISDFQISEGIPELIAGNFPENSQIYDPFTAEQENLVAYSFNGGARSLYSLVENIRNLPPLTNNDTDNPQWIKDYCQLLGLYDIMAMEARKLGMDTLPEIVSYVDQRFGNHVLDLYYTEVIEPRLVPTSEDLLNIYESERDMLILSERRIFRTISAVGQEQLDLLEQVMDSSGDPFILTDELTIVQSLLAPGESNITAPLTTSAVPPPWDETLFSLELNETTLCSITAERVLVFELIEIKPENIPSFEESQDQLIEMHNSLKEEEVISGLVDSLSSVYHIEIDREFIDRFIYSDSSEVDLQ